jgi:ribosomal subunit interface protein
MHITIKYTKLDSTPAMDVYVREKIGQLSKLLKGLDKKGTVEAHVEIARTTKHHQKGNVFCAECNLELPGRTLRAEHSDWDARRCIDEIKNELQQEIKKYSARFRPQDSEGQKKLRRLRGKT